MRPAQWILALGLAIVATSTAVAQNYPTRPIRIVVPFPPGGLTDILAREVGQKLSASWGQPVVVDNRPGAGGIPGAEIVANAPADGYTVLLANTNLAINPSLYRSLPYDTVATFVPVVQAISVPNLLVVPANSPARTLRDLIDLAKARPGKLNYASAGNGTFPHLAVEMFKMYAGVNVVHIPYKGAAPAMNAILAKEVDLLSNDIPGALPHIKAGTVRALAITSRTRSPSVPDVPTVAESGVNGYEAVGWQGFMVRTGTPQSVVDALSTQIVAALKSPDLNAKLVAQGVDVVASTPAEFAAFFAQDMERWAKTVKASGARAD